MLNSPKKILVVEDHDDTRKVVVMFLEGCKYDVQSAATFTRAAQLLAQETFDVLVADIGLPDGSGFDLMRLAGKSNARGIALTGRNHEGDVEAALAAGFQFHLTKPADFSALKKAVEKVLAQKP